MSDWQACADVWTPRNRGVAGVDLVLAGGGHRRFFTTSSLIAKRLLWWSSSAGVAMRDGLWWFYWSLRAQIVASPTLRVAWWAFEIERSAGVGERHGVVVNCETPSTMSFELRVCLVLIASQSVVARRSPWARRQTAMRADLGAEVFDDFIGHAWSPITDLPLETLIEQLSNRPLVRAASSSLTKHQLHNCVWLLFIGVLQADVFPLLLRYSPNLCSTRSSASTRLQYRSIVPIRSSLGGHLREGRSRRIFRFVRTSTQRRIWTLYE